MFASVISRRLRMVSLKRVQLERPMTRARHIFALMATYGLQHVRAHEKVSRRIRKYRQQWLHMLEQLCEHQLWSPVTDIRFTEYDGQEEARFDFAFGLCCRCLPTCVKWSFNTNWRRRIGRKIRADIIPCRKTNICPACFGAVSEQQYRQCKQVVNLLQQKDGLLLTARVETAFVPAAAGYDPDFQQTEMLAANVSLLRDAMRQRRVPNGSALHKRLQRHTLGAFWRILAVPQVGGWNLVTRWVLLTERGVRPPETVFDPAVAVSEIAVDVPPRESWLQQHTESDIDEKMVEALLTFATYPREFLTGDVDLVAAWLNAAARTRVVSGMGLLTQAGSSLLPRFKKMDKTRRAQRKKKPSRGQNAPT